MRCDKQHVAFLQFLLTHLLWSIVMQRQPKNYLGHGHCYYMENIQGPSTELFK